MTENQIERINSIASDDQGIFVEPWGIPVDVKEPVIYTRYKVGGSEGGNCWGRKSHTVSYQIPENYLEILDIVLHEICPDIKYSDYKKIENIINSNEETEREYYGNSSDYEVKYIVVSELENLLKFLGYNL